MSRVVLFACLMTVALDVSSSRAADDRFETDVFTSGTDGAPLPSLRSPLG